jgi:hypothetical protein
MRELVDTGAKVTPMGEYMVVQEYQDVPHEFVAIAAYITSYARIELFKHIMAAGPDYVYSDTDSVHTTGELEERYGLGGLKHEHAGAGVYIGKKVYALKNADGQKVKAKGLGRMHTGVKPSYKLFSLLARDKILSYQFEFMSFPTVREVLMKEVPPCKPLLRKRTLRKT